MRTTDIIRRTAVIQIPLSATCKCSEKNRFSISTIDIYSLFSPPQIQHDRIIIMGGRKHKRGS